MVVLAGIFVAEPAVVHHEEFSAHGGDVSHHLGHALFVDVEIDSLPAVEQYVAFLVAVAEHILAPPTVEVAADSAEPLVAEGQRKGRSGEGLAFGEARH